MALAHNQRDRFCLSCGYNLRGLAGDPIRCPECAHLNLIADLEIAPRRIQVQLRRLETGPALCVTAATALCGWLLPLLWLMLYRPLTPPPLFVRAFLMAMIVASVVAWAIGLAMFRSSCRGRVGWVDALLAFHLYGLVIAALGLAALWLVLGLPMPRGLAVPLLPSSSTRPTLIVIMIAALVLVALRLYRRAKAAVRPMQRIVAADAARERVEKR